MAAPQRSRKARQEDVEDNRHGHGYRQTERDEADMTRDGAFREEGYMGKTARDLRRGKGGSTRKCIPRQDTDGDQDADRGKRIDTEGT